MKSPTIGIEPPAPIVTAFLPHSSASAGARLVERRIVERQLRAPAKSAKLANSTVQSTGSRALHEGAERLADLLGVLLAHQTERHLRRRLAGDHGLGALAGVAADDAVDLGGRPRGDLLDQHPVLFAGRHLQADLPEELLGGQVEPGQVGLDVGRQFRARRHRSRGW